MLIIAALILAAALFYFWVRLIIGAVFFGHRYFIMYLAFMAPVAYLTYNWSQTLFALVILQMGMVLVHGVVRHI